MASLTDITEYSKAGSYSPNWKSENFLAGAPAGQSNQSMDVLAAYMANRGLQGQAPSKREMARTRTPQLSQEIGKTYANWLVKQREQAQPLIQQQANLFGQRADMLANPGTHQVQTGTKDVEKQIQEMVTKYRTEQQHVDSLADITNYPNIYAIGDPYAYLTNQELFRGGNPATPDRNDYLVSNPDNTRTLYTNPSISYRSDPGESYGWSPTDPNYYSVPGAIATFLNPEKYSAFKSESDTIRSTGGSIQSEWDAYKNLLSKYGTEVPMEQYIAQMSSPENLLRSGLSEANRYQLNANDLISIPGQQPMTLAALQELINSGGDISKLTPYQEQVTKTVTEQEPVYENVPNVPDTTGIDQQLASLAELLSQLNLNQGPTGLNSTFQDIYREDPLWSPGNPEENFRRRFASGALAE